VLVGLYGPSYSIRYDAVASAVRAVDTETMILYEPVTFGMLADGPVFGDGFARVPINSTYASTSALSVHYYCFSFGNVSAVCDALIGPDVFAASLNDTSTTGSIVEATYVVTQGMLGGGLIMTEMQGCQYLHECVETFAEADGALVSWW
jgi:hypothetical protein